MEETLKNTKKKGCRGRRHGLEIGFKRGLKKINMVKVGELPPVRTPALMSSPWAHFSAKAILVRGGPGEVWKRGWKELTAFNGEKSKPGLF